MRTRTARAMACLGAALALVLTACTSTTAPNPAPAPLPSDVKLDGWQLTLPIANAESGDADTISNFQDVIGGSGELVQVDNFAAGTQPRTLTASATVTQLPNENPDVILGQIHGAEDIKSVAWVMLHYFDGAIKVVVKQAREGDASQDYILADSVPLNTPFTFRLSDNGNGTLTFGLDANGQTKQETAPVPPVFSGATVRFQVGAYQQADSEQSTSDGDGARVTFTKITTDDKPAPAPTP